MVTTFTGIASTSLNLFSLTAKLLVQRIDKGIKLPVYVNLSPQFVDFYSFEVCDFGFHDFMPV
jgi:hypothetical protein